MTTLEQSTFVLARRGPLNRFNRFCLGIAEYRAYRHVQTLRQDNRSVAYETTRPRWARGFEARQTCCSAEVFGSSRGLAGSSKPPEALLSTVIASVDSQAPSFAADAQPLVLKPAISIA